MLVFGGRYETLTLSCVTEFVSPFLTSKSVAPDATAESDESKSFVEISELPSSGEIPDESSVVDDDELSLSKSDEPNSSFPKSSKGEVVVV